MLITKTQNKKKENMNQSIAKRKRKNNKREGNKKTKMNLRKLSLNKRNPILKLNKLKTKL